VWVYFDELLCVVEVNGVSGCFDVGEVLVEVVVEIFVELLFLLLY